MTPRSPPSLTPRRFAAANAALVRSEMRSASSSATMAMMPTVSRFAFGMSAATKSTPDSFRPSRKWAFARQSIELCDDKPCPVQAAHGSFRQFWPIGALAALDLGELAADGALFAWAASGTVAEYLNVGDWKIVGASERGPLLHRPTSEAAFAT